MNEVAAVEALLFVAGDEGLSLDEVASLVGISTQHAYELLMTLQSIYDQSDRGLMLLEVGTQYELATKKEYAEVIRKYAQSPFSTNLSQAALETLAIVAYKQPLTRMEIEEIRGVQAGGALQKLMLRGLIEDKGRVEGPGRAILYGTTDYFMDYFGLKRLEDLPELENIAMPAVEQESDLFFERFQQLTSEEKDGE